MHGVRTDGEAVIRIAQLGFDRDRFTIPRLVVDLADGVQIVYVDRNGDPLPGEPLLVSVEALAAAGPMEDKSVTRRADLLS